MYEYRKEDFERMDFRPKYVVLALKEDVRYLMNAFYWDETKEGEKFWSRVHVVGGRLNPEIAAKLWFMLKLYEEITGEKII